MKSVVKQKNLISHHDWWSLQSEVASAVLNADIPVEISLGPCRALIYKYRIMIPNPLQNLNAQANK